MQKQIDPWGSDEIKIDEKLLKEFGLKEIPENYLNTDHYLLKRKILLAHRDLDKIAQRIKNKQPFIQLTGIASSGPLHLGHKLDIDIFLMFRELGAISRFVISDIDAFVSRPDDKVPSMKEAKKYAADIVAHLLAFGVKKEEIYVQSQQKPSYFQLAFEASKKITENAFRATYGHVNPGKLSANILQYADILHLQLKENFGPMPSITCIGVEQDPHARICRDISRRLPYGFVQPSFAFFVHQTGLQKDMKMSASIKDSAIFLNDNPSDIKRKINRAFSGGRETIEEHKKLGGIPEVDKAYEILQLHHPDTKLVQETYTRYKSGEMSTGELKKICIEFLTETLSKHQVKVESFREIANEIAYGKK